MILASSLVSALVTSVKLRLSVYFVFKLSPIQGMAWVPENETKLGGPPSRLRKKLKCAVFISTTKN